MRQRPVDRISDSVIPRRQVLGGILLGTSGALLGTRSLKGSQQPRLPNATAVINASAAAKMAAVEAKFGRLPVNSFQNRGPDGFLMDSIGGTVGAVDGSALVVLAGANQQPVSVAITPQTKVVAGGSILLGQLSLCNPGDLVFAATSFNGVGSRIASFVELNSATYWATVTQVAGNQVSLRTSLWGSDPNSDVEVLIMPMTSFDPAPPHVGDGIYCVATKATPVRPTVIWASFIETFPSPAFLQ